MRRKNRQRKSVEQRERVLQWSVTYLLAGGRVVDTFFFVGTSAAVFTTVNGRFSLISCLCFFFLYLTDFQSFPVVAGVGVRLRIIFHIFYPADVVLIRTLFPNLIIRRLDKCLFLFFLQISVILFTFISCIRRNSLVFKIIYVLFQILKKWDQCCSICRLRSYGKPGDIF